MSHPVKFNSAAPCLSVSDMARSLGFYRDILGFESGHLEGDPPVYATLHHDEVAIHLSLDRDGNKAGTSFCCVFVTGVDALYHACVSKGAKIARQIEDSPYGLRDFNLEDPDGNVVLFGEFSKIHSHYRWADFHTLSLIDAIPWLIRLRGIRRRHQDC